tara:strand:+ start:1135 stop:1371 length:237 start_codon:yes stop_codon:yes gene_type:complete
MPQIGWLEILIIVSLAIVIVGPKDFPIMLKKIGSWIGSIKRYISDVQNQVSDITNENIDVDQKKVNEEKDNNKDLNDK